MKPSLDTMTSIYDKAFTNDNHVSSLPNKITMLFSEFWHCILLIYHDHKSERDAFLHAICRS